MYLEGVHVQTSHWPRVFAALGDDDVALSGDDLRGVVQDDVSVLASRHEDARRVTLVYAKWTPNQFVVSVGGE